MTKILKANVSEKVKFTGLLDYMSDYYVILLLMTEYNGRIEAFYNSIKLVYR